MSDYIEREAVKEAIGFVHLHFVACGENKSLLDVINEIPAADVEPLVRCMDCKYHYWEQEPCHGKTVHYCELPHMRGIEIFKEFFCYYGERKDGDSNG